LSGTRVAAYVRTVDVHLQIDVVRVRYYERE